MNVVIVYITIFIILTLIDLGYLSLKPILDFHKSVFSSVQGFPMKIRMIPALLVYLITAMGLTWIYLNVVESQKVIVAAGLGLVAFGIYDLTNYATLSNYPLVMVIRDMMWGVSSYAVVMYLSTILVPRVHRLVA
jgi:uncharacterized membrane protein